MILWLKFWLMCERNTLQAQIAHYHGRPELAHADIRVKSTKLRVAHLESRIDDLQIKRVLAKASKVRL